MTDDELQAIRLEREQALNQSIREGRLVASVEDFCTDDIEMQEMNEPPVAGMAVIVAKERAFEAEVAAFEEITCLGWALRGDRSYSEWRFVARFHDGKRAQLDQMVVRHWRGALVSYERFYHQGWMPL